MASDVLEYLKLAQAGVTQSLDEQYEILDLTGCISRDSKYPVTGGGFADIYLATWTRNDREAQKVSYLIRYTSSRFDVINYLSLSRSPSRFLDIMLQTQTQIIDKKWIGSVTAIFWAYLS